MEGPKQALHADPISDREPAYVMFTSRINPRRNGWRLTWLASRQRLPAHWWKTVTFRTRWIQEPCCRIWRAAS